MPIRVQNPVPEKKDRLAMIEQAKGLPTV